MCFIVGYRTLKRQNMILKWLNEKKCISSDDCLEITRVNQGYTFYVFENHVLRICM